VRSTRLEAIVFAPPQFRQPLVRVFADAVRVSDVVAHHGDDDFAHLGGIRGFAGRRQASLDVFPSLVAAKAGDPDPTLSGGIVGACGARPRRGTGTRLRTTRRRG
jgi:hypothetical protein